MKKEHNIQGIIFIKTNSGGHWRARIRHEGVVYNYRPVSFDRAAVWLYEKYLELKHPKGYYCKDHNPELYHYITRCRARNEQGGYATKNTPMEFKPMN